MREKELWTWWYDIEAGKAMKNCAHCCSSHLTETVSGVACGDCGALSEEWLHTYDSMYRATTSHATVYATSPDFDAKYTFTEEFEGDPFPGAGFVTCWSTAVPEHTALATSWTAGVHPEVGEMVSLFQDKAPADSPDYGEPPPVNPSASDLRMFLSGYLKQSTVVGALGLPRSILHKSMQTYRQAAHGCNPRNRNVEALAVAALVAAVQNQSPSTNICMKQVAAASLIPEKEIIKHIKTGVGSARSPVASGPASLPTPAVPTEGFVPAPPDSACDVSPVAAALLARIQVNYAQAGLAMPSLISRERTTAAVQCDQAAVHCQLLDETTATRVYHHIRSPYLSQGCPPDFLQSPVARCGESPVTGYVLAPAAGGNLTPNLSQPTQPTHVTAPTNSDKVVIFSADSTQAPFIAPELT